MYQQTPSAKWRLWGP